MTDERSDLLPPGWEAYADGDVLIWLHRKTQTELRFDDDGKFCGGSILGKEVDSLGSVRKIYEMLRAARMIGLI